MKVKKKVLQRRSGRDDIELFGQGSIGGGGKGGCWWCEKGEGGVVVMDRVFWVLIDTGAAGGSRGYLGCSMDRRGMDVRSTVHTVQSTAYRIQRREGGVERKGGNGRSGIGANLQDRPPPASALPYRQPFQGSSCVDVDGPCLFPCAFLPRYRYQSR